MHDKIYDQRESTYNTAGVDNYAAKDAAAKRGALAALTGAGQLSAETTCEPVNMAHAVIGDIERLNNLLSDIGERQTLQLERLFGASPVGGTLGNVGKPAYPSGSLHLIADMLRDARDKAEYIFANQKKLEQVG